MAAIGKDFAEKEPRGSIVQAGAIEGVASANDDIIRRMSVVPGIAEVTDGAIAGTEAEKRMGIKEGLNLYPKAIGWSILLSTAIVMEGYDVVLLASFYDFPAFQQKYGDKVGPGPTDYQIPAQWQAALSVGANIGEILGLFATGIVAEKYGYRYTMIGALSVVIAFIFLPFFAQNKATLLAGEILCGIPW
jgi:MFS transporter, SP family, general alpha glucoside:H+ symporter